MSVLLLYAMHRLQLSRNLRDSPELLVFVPEHYVNCPGRVLIHVVHKENHEGSVVTMRAAKNDIHGCNEGRTWCEKLRNSD